MGYEVGEESQTAFSTSGDATECAFAASEFAPLPWRSALPANCGDMKFFRSWLVYDSEVQTGLELPRINWYKVLGHRAGHRRQRRLLGWHRADDRLTSGSKRPRLVCRSSAWLLVVVQQRHHFVALELLPPVQEIQFHDKAESGNLRAEQRRQLGRGLGGASGGQQIVHDQHALAFLDGVLVHLERVGAVFERVIELHGFGGKFANFAHGNKSGIQAVGQRRARR